MTPDEHRRVEVARRSVVSAMSAMTQLQESADLRPPSTLGLGRPIEELDATVRLLDDLLKEV